MKNNFITKIIGATLAFAMMIGGAVGINAAKQAKPVDAATSADWEMVTGALTAGTEYLIVSTNDDKCMQPKNSSPTGNTTASIGGYETVTFSASSAPANGFVFSDAGDGKFYIKDGSVFVYASGTTNNGLGSKTTAGKTDSVWNATDTGSGSYTLITESSRQLSEYSTNWRVYGTNSGSRTNVHIYQKATASTEPSLVFSEETINGEVGDEFSFTYTANNLTENISWSPASNNTNIINYSVNSGTNTVSGTLTAAGTVTLVATSGSVSDSVVFNVAEHITRRKYTIASTNSVNESGDEMTDAETTFRNTYSTKEQLTAGKEMTLSITGISKKVTINKLVFSMRSNGSSGSGYATISIDGSDASYLSGDADGVSFEEFGDEGTTYGTTYRDIVWDNLNFVAISSITIKIHATVNSLYCQWFEIYFNEEENVDVVTALSVTPNSWSGYDSQIIDVSNYSISVTKNGEAGTASDYTFQGIGYMNNDLFVARNAEFSSGHPVVADTRLCWKANYPTTPGGSTYLYAYVTLTVQADVVSTIALSGDLNATLYTTCDEWDISGLVATATFASSAEVIVTNNATFKFYSDSAMTNEVATPADLGTGADQSVYIKATYAGVSNAVGFEQEVSVVKVSRVVFNATSDIGSNSPVPSVSKSGITIATAVEEGTFERNDNYRVYSGKEVTISSSVENIVNIKFSFTSLSNNALTGEGYTRLSNTSGLWEGNASSVTLTSDGAQSRITKVIVTVASALYDVESTLSTTTSLSYHYEHENDAYTYTNVAIRFGSLMEQSLWSNLDNESLIAGYGVLITDDSVVSENDDIADAYDLAELSPEITDYYMPKANKATPSTATAKQKSDAGVTGDYYIWNLYFNIEEANFGTTYVAGAYIKLVSGDVVFMRKASFSVKSLAADYIANRNCNEQTAGGSLYNLAHYGE